MVKKIIIPLALILFVSLMNSCKTGSNAEGYNSHAVEAIDSLNMSNSERAYLKHGRHELKEMRTISKKQRLWKRK